MVGRGLLGLVRNASARANGCANGPRYPSSALLCPVARLDSAPGPGPVALRLLSVAVGVLAIPAIYLAGRRIFDPGVATLAATLAAVNAFHIYYSQEIRMYGLVALFSALMLATAWSLFDRPPQASEALRFVPYVVVVTGALYTQYYTVFLPVGLTLFALWHWRRSLPALWRWLAAQAVCALLYLPWVLYAAPKAGSLHQQQNCDGCRPAVAPLALLWPASVCFPSRALGRASHCLVAGGAGALSCPW